MTENEIKIRLSLLGMGSVQTGLARLQAGLTSLARIALPALGGAGLAVLGKTALENADQVGKLSQKTGELTEELSANVVAAKLGDVELRQLQLGYKTLGQQMAASSEVFRDLGINARAQDGSLRALGDVMGDVADKFAAMPDGAEKANAAVKLFGKSGLDLIPMLNDGRLGLEAMRSETERLGVLIDKNMAKSADHFGDELDKIKFAAQGVALEIARQLLPDLLRMAKGITDTIVEMRQWIAAHREGIAVAKDLAATLLIAGVALTAYRVAMNAATAATVLAFGAKAIGSAKDMVAAFQLIPSLMLAAGTAIGKTNLIIAALAAGTWTAVEAWRAWKAVAGLDGSQERAAAQIAGLREQILKTADELAAAGRLSPENRAALSDLIAKLDAAGLSSSGLLGQLTKVAKMVRELMPARVSAIAVDPKEIAAAREAELRELELRSKHSQLLKSKAEAENETAFAEQRRGLEEYLALKLELTEQESREEIELLDKQLEQARVKLLEAVGAGATNAELFKLNNAVIGLRIEQANSDVKRETNRARIEADGRRQRIEAERRDIQESLVQLNADFTRSEANKFAERKTLLERDRALQGLGGPVPGLGPDPSSFGQQWSATLTKLQDQWGTWAQQVSSSFANTFNDAISSISGSITNLIVKTGDWGAALREIGVNILTSVVNAIVQMGVRWVSTQLVMFLFGRSIQAAALATNAAMAASLSAIWATPATLATISSYGGAAAAAPGAIALAQGLVLGQSLAAFAEGGVTPGLASLAIVGEEGPEGIITNRALKHYGGRSFVDSINSLSLPAGGALGGGLSPGAINVGAAPVHVAILKDPKELEEFLSSRAGERIVIQHVNGAKIELGHRT